ncbi:pyrazinamidase/nicotinamidase [Coprinopsis sp. MPI-PUGE-AT-0042]|nr:pyrazinamidase/nicotinamidase [Coprinopsis sp. MPI-PUGE-AT-0042]
MSMNQSTTPVQPSPLPDDAFVPALIVIDMQNDFVTGSLAVPEGAAIIPKINELLALPFKLKVATRDFHPGNHVSFAASHNSSTFSKKVIFHPEDEGQKHGLEQVLWPTHCVANTSGADFVPGLDRSQFDYVLHKGTHQGIESYSAFQDIWGKGTTELPGLLKEKGVTDVFFVGLAGDYCVKYSAIDSVKFGFRTWVIMDGTRCISNDGVAFDIMTEAGVKFSTVEDVATRL